MQPAAKESTRRRQDVNPYPVRRVVGTVATAQQADATVEGLLNAGFERHDIEVLHGEEGLRRLDPPGTDRGLLAHVQRRLVRSVGDCEEITLERHTKELRMGRFVIMVRAEGRNKRKVAADVLNANGSEFTRYCGRWFWESLDAGPARLRRTARERTPGQMYEVAVDDARLRLRFQSGASAVVTGNGRAASHAAVVRLRPGLSMLTWKSPDGMTVVHVHDYESSRVYAVLTERDGSSRQLTGTIRRLT